MAGPKKIDRIKVVQDIINRKKSTNYLEIGVLAGDAFLRIKSRRKWAVDPDFMISPAKKIRYYFKNPYNILNKYFRMESDVFFDTQMPMLSEYGIDVAFVDGLHTFEQSLQDVQNTLKYLNKNGVIVLHDCNPVSEAAAYPATSIAQVRKINPPGFDGIWNGDVWKTIAYLRATRKDLRVFVLDCDFGLGVVTQGAPENMLDYSADAVQNLSYRDLSENRKSLLNLKDARFIEEFLKNRK
ncbi:MAG: class I SAM-dependent methyltransferase [Smithella sp.]|nr:class I SAM-dependent methyltransferase [Smithella sp.]